MCRSMHTSAFPILRSALGKLSLSPISESHAEKVGPAQGSNGLGLAEYRLRYYTLMLLTVCTLPGSTQHVSYHDEQIWSNHQLQAQSAQLVSLISC